MAASETIRRAAMNLSINGAAEFKQSMGEINRQLKQSQAELNKVTAAYGKNEKNVETLTAQKNHLIKAIDLNRQEQQRLNEELARATEQYGENSREVQVLQTKLTNAEAKGVAFTRQLNETTVALEEQERALRGLPWTELGQKLEATGEKMQAVGKRMTDVGKTMSLAITAPLMAIGVQAIRVGADFENSMGTVQARTGMAADEVEKLGREFRDMAVSGEYGAFTAREIAAAYAGIAVAGQDVTTATDIMRSAQILATATGNSLGKSAYFLGNYLLKVGKDSSYAEKYIDLFAQGIQNSGIGLSDLQNYVFRMTPAFEQFGASSETNIAILTRLYQAGVRNAALYSGMGAIMMQAATGTGNFAEVLSLAAGSTDAFTKAGLEWYAGMTLNESQLFDLAMAMGEYKDQTQIAAIVSSSLTDAQQAAWFEFMTLAEEIQNEVIPSFDAYGVAVQMAAVENSGLSATSAQTRAALEELKLQIADALLPHIQRLADFVSGLVRRFASLDEGTQRTVLAIAGIAAAIGPVLLIGGKLVTTVGKITSSFGAASIAIGKAGSVKALWATKNVPLSVKANATLLASMVKLKAGFVGMTASIKSTSLAATASVKAYGIKATAMKAFAVTSGIVTGGLAAVKAAFIKLKTVMLANPIGLIVAGITALAGGIAYLIVRANRVSEAYQEMAEETARLTERQHELTEASAAAAGQFANNLQGMQNQAQYYRNLADEIERLSTQQNLSAGEMELLQRKINELNGSMPGLNLAFDEYSGALNVTAEAMRAYLAAAEGRQKLNAMTDESLRLERELLDLQNGLMETMQKREALEEQLNDGTSRRNADTRALNNAIAELKESENAYTAVIEANRQIQADIAAGIEVHADAVRELERAQAEAAQVVAELTAEMEAQARTAEELERAHEQALEKVEAAFVRYSRIASNAFGQVSESSATTVAEMIDNLQHNTQALEEWSRNIAILTDRGVNEGLVDQLRNAGPASAATVRELVNACDEELNALNNAFKESTRVAVESMKREFDPAGVVESAEELINKVAESILDNQSMEDALVNQITNAFESLDNTISSIGFDIAGTNAIEGFTSGVDSMQIDVRNAGENTGENLLNALNSELESNSPSRATQRIGVYAGEGLIRGVEAIQPRVIDTAQTLTRAFISAISDKIQNNPDINNATRRAIEDMRQTADMAVMNVHFDSIGHEMANGVARGIQNGGGIVSNAARNMINNALNAMRAAAVIHSPSRRTMEMGAYMGDGIIIGLMSKTKELAEACKRITETAIAGLYIDPDEFLPDAGGILQSVKRALPTMQSYVQQANYQQYAAATASPPASITVDMTGGHYYIREDADIMKIAKAVKKELSRDVEYASRIGG